MKRIGIADDAACARFFASLVLTALFAALTIGLIGLIGCHKIETDLASREYAIAGRLIRTGGGRSAAVAEAFASRAADASDIQTGRQALAAEGYGIETISSVFSFPAAVASWQTAFSILAALLASGACALAAAKLLRGIFGALEEACHAASAVSRGAYRTRLGEYGEGAVSRFSHAFNEMAAGVSTGFEKLGAERVFLQNLISDISHQLKTPLAALKMYNEIILLERPEGAVKDFTERSQTELERMEWLVLGLLKMARIEAGGLMLEKRKCDLTALAQEVLSGFSAAAEEKHAALCLRRGLPGGRQPSPPEAEIRLCCDPGWMKEAVGNVVKNCLEYTPEGGRVTVEVGQTAVMVVLRVSDTGAGIDPDDLPHIFRRFYRGKGSRGSGNGIGLSLAKSITEQMGGTLSAGNGREKGAVFTFTFLKDVI